MKNFVWLVFLFLAVISFGQQYNNIFNPPQLTGLIGSGATNLDGVLTENLPTGSLIAVFDGTDTRLYCLTTGTDAEDSPSVIRPDDFVDPGNAKVWVLRLSSDPEETGYSGGGSSLWADSTTFIKVDGQKGIFGYYSIGYGDSLHTHINLGFDCRTGFEGGGANRKYCTIGGGGGNTANGDYATVGGGCSNTAGNNYATVGGGFFNTANYIYATVGGGEYNSASGWSATVAGGQYNTASGWYAAVAGGEQNTASNYHTTVGGGYWNNASNYYAAVGGGRDNLASGQYAAIGGGQSDTASGDWATVGGGHHNIASDSFATVSGGQNNTASVHRSTVGGGHGNAASNEFATIGGGSNNTASGRYASIGGGSSNTASNQWATVAGGYWNTASGNWSTITGGYCAVADKYGQQAHASGFFGAVGDAQSSIYILRKVTTSGAAKDMFLDGGGYKMVLNPETAWAFTGTVVAIRQSNSDADAWKIEGCIVRDGADNTTLVGSSVTNIGSGGATGWTVSLSADDINEALNIRVDSSVITNIRWVATVRTTEVTYP